MNHLDTDPFVGEIFSKCYLDSTEGLLDRTQSILQSKVLVQKVGGVTKLLYRYSLLAAVSKRIITVHTIS